MENKGIIYKIENKVDGKTYIGQSIRGAVRIKEHQRKLRKNIHDNCYLQNAYNKYGEECFLMEIIGEYNHEELNSIERKLIEENVIKGISYNLESGGSVGKKLSILTRKKISDIQKSKNWVKGEHPRARKVVCIDDDMTFDSIVEAAEHYGISYANIHQVVSGKNVSAKSKEGKWVQFSYYTEGKKYIKKKHRVKNTIRKVICINTKEVFESTMEAGKIKGVSQGHISMVCNHKRNYAGKDKDGYFLKWCFFDEYDESEWYDFIPQKRKKENKVRCLQTGEVFNSAQDAAEKYNLKNRSGIYSSCRGKGKVAGISKDGTLLEWEYI